MTRKSSISLDGLSEVKKYFIIGGQGKEFDSFRNGVFSGELIEPIPNFIQAGSEVVYRGKNNNYIVMGRDRPGLRSSGYGGKGDTQASMIDIVVGRMSYQPVDDVYVDPDFENDAARIYISQKTDVDRNFDLSRVTTADSVARSAIALKADALRFISREEIKIISGHGDLNSQGGDISFARFGISLIADNEDATLQPIVKGDNLIDALVSLSNHVSALSGIVEGLLMEQDKFNKALKDHWHISPFKGMRTSSSPTVKIQGAATIKRHGSKTFPSLKSMKARIVNFQKNYLEPSGAGYINSKRNKVN